MTRAETANACLNNLGMSETNDEGFERIVVQNIGAYESMLRAVIETSITQTSANEVMQGAGFEPAKALSP